MAQQDRISDAALLRLLDTNDDVSWLTPEEKQRMVSLASSHQKTEAPKDFRQFGPMQQLLREQANPDATRFGPVDALPQIGGAVGGMIGGTGGTVAGFGVGGVPGAMGGAAVGGAGGEALRQLANRALGRSAPATMGEAAKGIGEQGLVQGATEGTGRLAVGALKLAGRGLMKGTVPKNIAKEFQGQVDIPQEMLDRNVFPGIPASARRVSAQSAAANAEREAAAQTVPVMPRSKVIAGLRPLHAKAVTAKEPKLADAVLEHMRSSARDIGPGGLSGPAALARKDIQQDLASAALNNPNTAAIAPKLHNAERGALVSHLRETPRMAKGLDESQTLMAIKQVMEDAALSNPVTRARIGGLTAASLSPVGLGISAQAATKGAPLVSPQMLRAIQLALLSQEQE